MVRMWESLSAEEYTLKVLLSASVSLLHSVLIEPAETFSEVPAQCDGENVEEPEQSKRIEKNHGVLQKRESWKTHRRTRG